MDIITDPTHSVLRDATEPVNNFNETLLKTARRMHGAMLDADGVGLAAPQVNIAKRFSVLLPETMPQVVTDAALHGGILAIVNPLILKRSAKEETLVEGCLSLPDVAVAVPRAHSITLQAQTLTGKRFTATVRGYPARILQHEIDHLDGMLITDRGTVVINDENDE